MAAEAAEEQRWRDAERETCGVIINSIVLDGDHALLVLHGLRSNERVETYELDCFITQQALVTVHRGPSPAVDAMRAAAMSHPALLVGGSGEVAARLADGVTRRILAIVDAFDLRVDGMIEQALVADRQLLNDVAAVRSDVSSLRRIVHPQRETLDLVRTSESELLTDLTRTELLKPGRRLRSPRC
jgi:Mg2+ and Co2+ transporter CorA